jgi:hypothetical protein
MMLVYVHWAATLTTHGFVLLHSLCYLAASNRQDVRRCHIVSGLCKGCGLSTSNLQPKVNELLSPVIS